MTLDPADLRRRLASRTIDLRTLDRDGFRRWLDAHLVRWQSDPVFVQRLKIRELRKGHPELRRLERSYRDAWGAADGTPAAVRLASLDRQRHRAERAVTGLTEALGRARPDDRPRLEAKRQAFLIRQPTIAAERAGLVGSTPQLAAVEQAADALRCLRTQIGLDREEVLLAELQTARGQRAGRAGEAFEQQVALLTRSHIVPRLGVDEAHLLHGVRLGAAGVEFDTVVVREPIGEEPVEVLAVVEAKRNINDLAHGFLRRQIDLGWLTGEMGSYDPAGFHTGQFPAGHFDRPAAHWQGGRAYTFAPGSFRRFARGAPSGYYVDGLHLVTRAGPVWGVPTAALGRIARRVATDENWNPADDEYMSRLFGWCRSLAGPVETPDVLDLYTRSPEVARQLLLLD